MDDDLDLGDVFTEPPRPPTPEPTIATYIRDDHQNRSTDRDDDWRDIRIRLVGAHPLWAHYLWNAARALASYMDVNRYIYKDRCVLELGAGGALPSLVAAKNGAHKVVITDYPDTALVDNIAYNVSENLEVSSRERVDVQGYIWGNRVEPLLDAIAKPGSSPEANPRGFHLIILSDLIFNHSQHDALLKTCSLALTPSNVKNLNAHDTDQEPEPCILVFYSHHRPHLASRDMQFFSKAQESGWTCEEILTKTFPPMFPEDSGEESVRSTVHGWRLTRRHQ